MNGAEVGSPGQHCLALCSACRLCGLLQVTSLLLASVSSSLAVRWCSAVGREAVLPEKGSACAAWCGPSLQTVASS